MRRRVHHDALVTLADAFERTRLVAFGTFTLHGVYMSTMMRRRDPIQAPEAESALLHRTEIALQGPGHPRVMTDSGEEIALPESLIRTVRESIGHLIRGDALFISPLHRHLTTTEAGDLLGVSRHHLTRLIDVRYQGAGRFDDPERLVPVLYGAPLLRTCLLEFVLPWAVAPGRSLLANVPVPTDEDEAADAARDRQLATEPRRIPALLYDRVAIRVRAEPALRLLGLRDIAVREKLCADEALIGEIRSRGFSQLDRGAVLSPHRPLTQAIVGAMLRNSVFNRVDGIYGESRHPAKR